MYTIVRTDPTFGPAVTPPHRPKPLAGPLVTPEGVPFVTEEALPLVGGERVFALDGKTDTFAGDETVRVVRRQPTGGRTSPFITGRAPETKRRRSEESRPGDDQDSTKTNSDPGAE